MISSEKLLEAYIDQNEFLLERIQKEIDDIPEGTRIALWGCGHHVSMLLAKTSLLEKQIVAVYDSDERKRGMLVADRPIHPFDISELEMLGIEKVVVTTYTAQKSIEAYIKRNGWELNRFRFLYQPL